MGGRGTSTFRLNARTGNSTSAASVSGTTYTVSDMSDLMRTRGSGGPYSEEVAKAVERSVTDMKVGTRLEFSGERGYTAIFEKTAADTWLRDGSTDDTRNNSGIVSAIYGGRYYIPSYIDIKKSDTYSPKKAENVIRTIGNDFTNNRSVVTKMGNHYQIDLFGADVNNTRLRNKLKKAGFTESTTTKGIWRK